LITGEVAMATSHISGAGRVGVDDWGPCSLWAQRSRLGNRR
jgi:hypothetical protein